MNSNALKPAVQAWVRRGELRVLRALALEGISCTCGGVVKVQVVLHHLRFKHNVIKWQNLAIPWAFCAFISHSHIVWFSYSNIEYDKLRLRSCELYRVVWFAPGTRMALVFEWNFFIGSTNEDKAGHIVFDEGNIGKRVKVEGSADKIEAELSSPFITLPLTWKVSRVWRYKLGSTVPKAAPRFRHL